MDHRAESSATQQRLPVSGEISAPVASDSGRHLPDKVMEYLRGWIQQGILHPGDRLPPERCLADRLSVSRATVRLALACLTAMGVLRSRRGVGTFVADGPPEIGRSALEMLGVLHGFQSWQMFEARILLEGSAAELAAQRARQENFRIMAEQVAEMYATCDSPAEYLLHDLLFHRAIATAARNPILAALVETVSAAVYETRRNTLQNSGNLRESADLHHGIYRAIRAREAKRARELMIDHLQRAHQSPATGTCPAFAGVPQYRRPEPQGK